MAHPSDIAIANLRCAAALIDTLARLGVRHFVVSSGSRCAPLVLAVSQHPDVRIWTHPDERAAGFRALGIGKSQRKPAALICTSGTAAANYYPAVIEARQSHTPLIVLTADRPPHRRGKGAPQTVDQVNLYARYPRYFADLPVPEPGDKQSDAWRDHAGRAFTSAMGCPAGPAHLNVPFDEPLIPEPAITGQIIQDAIAGNAPLPPSADAPAIDPSPQDDWDAVRADMRRAHRLLVVYGPQDDGKDPGGVLVAAPAWSRVPVLADVASQLRTLGVPSNNIFAHYDLYLRDASFASRVVPDLVIRLGGLPTSKVLNEWLAECRVPVHIAVGSHRELADPYGLVTRHVIADPNVIARQLASLPDDPHCDPAYLRIWQAADEAAATILAEHDASRSSDDLFEAQVVATLFHHAPQGGIVYLSNSMPIRWADAWVPSRSPAVRVLVNRGANGIDGMIASAAGAASVWERPVTLVIGDIAFLHDLNGLWGLVRDNLPLKIVLLDNNGGGIFSFLPIARHQRVFDPLVAMPHGLDLAAAAALYGIPFSPAASLAEFGRLYLETIGQPGPQIIAVHTDRQRTFERHQEICRRIAARLPREGP